MAEYKEHTPPEPLSAYVECFWELKGEVRPGENVQQVLVPGGRAEIFFTTTPFYWYGNNKDAEPKLVADAFLLGPRKAVNYAAMLQNYECFGARLKAGCLQLFTRIPASIHSNNVTSLAEVFGPLNFPQVGKMSGSGDAEQIIVHVSDWLEKQLEPPPEDWCQLQQFLIQLSDQVAGGPDIKELAAGFGWNYKKAERVFLKHVGLSPQTVLRLFRFRHAIEQIKSNPGSLTDAAHQFGFYDQSHFIREFHQYAGSNPSSFYKNIPEIAALLYKLNT